MRPLDIPLARGGPEAVSKLDWAGTPTAYRMAKLIAAVTFDLLINLKIAKAYGLTVPPSLLGRDGAGICSRF